MRGGDRIGCLLPVKQYGDLPKGHNRRGAIQHPEFIQLPGRHPRTRGDVCTHDGTFSNSRRRLLLLLLSPPRRRVSLSWRSHVDIYAPARASIQVARVLLHFIATFSVRLISFSPPLVRSPLFPPSSLSFFYFYLGLFVFPALGAHLQEILIFHGFPVFSSTVHKLCHAAEITNRRML